MEDGVAKIKPEFLVSYGTSDIGAHSVTKEGGRNVNFGTSSSGLRQLCNSIILNKRCKNPKCNAYHDLDEFSVHYTPPQTSIPCHFLKTYGKCPFSVNCMYASSHFQESLDDLFAKKPVPTKEEIVPLLNAFPGATLADLRRGEYRKLGEKGSSVMPSSSFISAFAHSKSSSEQRPLILAPMCTVGTVPFRRLCIHYGCEITLCEMVFARDILHGDAQELRKIKRHPDEKCFGIQLAGRGQELMEIVNFISKCCSCDFVDLNAACPQDIATKKCCGAALAANLKKLVNSVDCMVRGGEHYGIPVFLKIRAGDLHGNWTGSSVAHALRLSGLYGLSVHLRTAKQRYSKLANWDYSASMRHALDSCEENTAKPDLEPQLKYDVGSSTTVTPSTRTPPLLGGNGDIFDYTDLYRDDHSTVDYYLIARGALVKPWIFQEIKEGRRIDMSSQSRLDMLRLFASFCLEYYGSDAPGVEKARTQFLENWSFMCRYIPVGILDEPQRLNQRPPMFRGRDELETLMASQSASDWVKISEMLFGPVPAGFSFVPKHKSHGYVSESVN
ncbi:Dihydrouridine synthase, putative [Giardia lamblia P15]|uniref:tRNA-dihydrouridine(47) synthase [NAD(P)(+)] n=1 Tax=Giardia intestinalis (strain P15) TaxID=658858 RepID=E1F4X1_GIAIA|nr:Dihydrouridine synthase, putative [Giardia lamblia P15]